MNVGSGRVSEREQEYGVPYGEYAINADMEYILSDEFGKKFKNITENKAVNETLLQCARNAIYHRNGTLFEDMYLINGNTGEIMGEQLDSQCERGIIYNESIKSAIAKAQENKIPLIAFHSHPEGYPPSIDDFNKAYINNYHVGVIAGHNGQVYVYSNKIGSFDNVYDIQSNIAFLCSGGYDVDRAHHIVYGEIGVNYYIAKG